MTLQIIHAQECAPQPWRNGGGQTRELLVWPPMGEWQLRISRAGDTPELPYSTPSKKPSKPMGLGKPMTPRVASGGQRISHGKSGPRGQAGGFSHGGGKPEPRGPKKPRY